MSISYSLLSILPCIFIYLKTAVIKPSHVNTEKITAASAVLAGPTSCSLGVPYEKRMRQKQP